MSVPTPDRLPDAVNEAIGRLTVALKLLGGYAYLLPANPDEDEMAGYDISVAEDIVRSVRDRLKASAAAAKGRAS
jgi:hypothetical protein